MKDLIKKIRDYTGAGFSECKKAAEASNGDFDVAMEILKAKGIERAAKKVGNEVDHGSILLSSNISGDFVALHFQAQTDFAVKSDAFCKFVENEADLFLNSDEENLNCVLSLNGETFQDRLSFFISTLGENVVLKNCIKFKSTADKKYISYIHNKINSNFQNIGLLGVVLSVNPDADMNQCLNVAKHVAAADSCILSSDLITEEMRKDHEDIDDFVLLDQNYFYDESLTVNEFLAKNNIQVFDFQVFLG